MKTISCVRSYVFPAFRLARLVSSFRFAHRRLEGDASHSGSKAYGAFLARAPQGMVFSVPPGAKRDKTSNPVLYGGVYGYLTELGLPTA